jgi:hypothetical protein
MRCGVVVDGTSSAGLHRHTETLGPLIPVKDCYKKNQKFWSLARYVYRTAALVVTGYKTWQQQLWQQYPVNGWLVSWISD